MLTLFSVPTANGQRAQIALEEAGLSYTVRSVDLRAGEHRSEEMLARNPFGRMPVLEIDGSRHLYGSLAIGHFAALETGRLLPADDALADMHQWLGIIMSDLGPAFSAHFYLGVLAPEPDEWALAWYADIIERFLAGVDAHLEAREFFVGDSFTLADAMMYPTVVTSAVRIPGGLGGRPNLERWAAAIGTREAVQRGMAACPGTL